MKQSVIESDRKTSCNTYTKIKLTAEWGDRTRIRIATVADLTAIVECLDLAFARTEDAYEDGEAIRLTERLSSRIAEGSISLICRGEHILGYISFWPTSEHMFIDTLAILPAHRRQGLGKKLLGAADVETLRLGLKAVTLFTKAAQESNLKFYQNSGYRETGRCDDDGFCRVFYTKMLC